MSTVSRDLPAQPHLDVPKREARELLKEWRAGVPEALERIRGRHPRYASADAQALAAAKPRLADAQLVLAREYGLASWPDLKRRIESNDAVRALLRAIRDDSREKVRAILRAEPELLHVPLWGGNWGPPMSHAANLGRLEIIQDCAALGARDHQHAFDRAILQGQLECARWLHAHGAKLAPGLVMGPCETLNPEGLRFLAELGAPFTSEQGDRLAPLALAIQTYGRNPAGKHAVLDIFAQQGYALPDTPMVAFHRGQLDRLAAHVARNPSLLTRRYSYHEIYPAELGCAADGPPGMHWTPIGGGTLLHLAIDFQETEIFEWLLAQGAEVNATASLDAEGFGGHTPLFHCVVAGPTGDEAMTRRLLERGAATAVRANLRKFLDWCDAPRWHVARDVTPTEWARGFPERNWVNDAAVRLIEGASNP